MGACTEATLALAMNFNVYSHAPRILVIGLRAHLDTERGWQLFKRAVRQQRAVSPVPREFARGRLAFSAHLR